MPFTKEKHLKLVGLIVVFGSGLSGHCFSFPCQTAEIWFEGKGRKEETRRQSTAESLTGINFTFQNVCTCNQQPKKFCYDHQEMMPINQSLNTAC